MASPDGEDNGVTFIFNISKCRMGQNIKSYLEQYLFFNNSETALEFFRNLRAQLERQRKHEEYIDHIILTYADGKQNVITDVNKNDNEATLNSIIVPDKSKGKQSVAPIVRPEPIEEPIVYYVEVIEFQPNQYPSYFEEPKPLTIVGIEKWSFEGIFDLLKASLLTSDRILLMTPFGSFFIYRVTNEKISDKSSDKQTFFLSDCCTCNANIFRYLDLSTGTAGFLFFCSLCSMVCYIMNAQFKNEKLNLIRKPSLDELFAAKKPVEEETEEVATK